MCLFGLTQACILQQITGIPYLNDCVHPHLSLLQRDLYTLYEIFTLKYNRTRPFTISLIRELQSRKRGMSLLLHYAQDKLKKRKKVGVETLFEKKEVIFKIFNVKKLLMFCIPSLYVYRIQQLGTDHFIQSKTMMRLIKVLCYTF